MCLGGVLLFSTMAAPTAMTTAMRVPPTTDPTMIGTLLLLLLVSWPVELPVPLLSFEPVTVGNLLKVVGVDTVDTVLVVEELTCVGVSMQPEICSMSQRPVSQ